MARKIEVQIVGDASSFHKALSQATGTSSKFGSVLGGAVRAGAYAAAGGIVALGAALKVGIDEFNDSQKAAAQTRAVLHSTGGAANVSAKHVKDLSESLLNLSGVDDEVIQGGENVLLTFRNIRNEAGKGNDIFDQATTATLDLSVAMGEDLHSASIQVGKALNDPVKGLTALKRVGVQFTDAQTTLIQKLVNTGKTAEAQKIILGELRKEFGGSAKAAGQTLSGQLDILKEKFKNAAGEVVAGLLPYVTRLANVVFPLIISVMKDVVGGLKDLIKWVGDAASHFEILGGKSSSTGDRIRHAWNQVVGFFNSRVVPIIDKLRGVFQDAMAAIAKTVRDHGDEVRRISQRVGGALRAIAEVAMPILRVALVKVLPKAIGTSITALDKITFALQKVADLVKWIGDHTPGELKKAASSFSRFSDQAVAALFPVLGPLERIRSLIEWISSHIPDIPSIPGFGGGPSATQRNPGQTLRGVGSTVTAGGSRVAQVNLHLDGKVLYSAVVNFDKDVRRQNGRSLLAT